MTYDIIIDQAGRIVLPRAVRQRLNLGPGTRLRAAVVAERIELTPESEPEPVFAQSSSKRRVLGPTGAGFDAAAATRAERDAQSSRR